MILCIYVMCLCMCPNALIMNMYVCAEEQSMHVGMFVFCRNLAMLMLACM